MTKATGPESELEMYMAVYRTSLPTLTPALNRLSFRYIRKSDQLVTFNGKVIGVSEELLSWNTKDMFIVFTHEVLHYLFHHIGRFRAYSLTERNRKAANLAMDLMVNRCIESVDENKRLLTTQPNGQYSFVLPEGMVELAKVIPPADLAILKQEHLTTELLYKYILEHYEELEEHMDSDPIAGDLIIEEDSPELNGPEATIAKTVWDKISSKLNRGTGNGDSIRDIEDYPEVTLDYRRELKEFMISHLSNRQITSFQRLSRRTLGQFGQGLIPPIQPGSVPEKSIRLACVAVDTSASITDEVLTELMANVNEIREQTGCRLYLIFCDYSITTEYEIQPEDDFLNLIQSGFIQAKGGGGTSFIPAQERMLNLGRKGIDDMDVGLYLTDGYGDWLDREEFPLANRLVWVLTPDTSWVDSNGNPTSEGPNYGKRLLLKKS